MKQNTLYILVLFSVLVVQITLALPTQTSSAETTILPQSDSDDEITTESLARQEEAGPTGPPGPPEPPTIDEESDEDEEEVTERATTTEGPVFTRRKVVTSDFGHVRPNPVPSEERPSPVKIDDVEDEVQEEVAQAVSTTTTTTLKPGSIAEEWAVVTGNATALEILEDAKAPKTTASPLTSTLSTFHDEWVAVLGNEAPAVKPVSNVEKVANGIQAPSESSATEDNEERQSDAVTELVEEVSSSATNLVDNNATSNDFEIDWALATGDEILSDPQAKAGCECGRVPFKVSDAGVNQWPWTGAVVTNGLFAGGRPHCGATLINSKYVLTAAHCVDGLLPYRTQVMLTVHDSLQNTISSSGTLKLEVEKILMHPNYNRRTNENDIALVALAEPVSIGQSYFVPACVPAGKNEYSEFIGKMAAWGSSELGPYKQRVNNNKLCKMDMPILSNDVCDRDTTHKGRITKTMLCAGFLTPKNDAPCVSDAGGGLIISNGGRHTLVGITSYGYTPNRAYSPTVHTRVSEYAEWILHNSLDADWCD